MEGKTTKLKDKELYDVVKSILEKVQQEKSLLSEMALTRKDYKDRIKNLSCQLLENWCLIRYCSITGEERYKGHWKKELRGFMLSMAKPSMKGNDSKESRQGVFDEVWSEEDYDMPEFLTLTIANKFIEEGFAIDSEPVIQCILDCIDAKEAIVDAILSRDVELVRSYVEEI